MTADGDDGDRAPGRDPMSAGKTLRRLDLAGRSLASVVAYAGHELNNQSALLLSTIELLRHEIAAAAVDPRASAAALAAVAATLDDQEEAIRRIARVARRLRTAALDERRAAEASGVVTELATEGASEGEGDGAAPETEPERPPAPRRRILFVDDEPGLRTALGNLLRRRHDVEIVDSGEQALARLAAGETFDVVLCDLMMPGLDGAAVHAAIQRDHAHRVGAFVLSTGGAFEEHAHALVESGEVHVLYKPYALRELLALVERVVPSEPSATRAD